MDNDTENFSSYDFNFIENFKYESPYQFSINCPYCGKSKHNKPHCGINLTKKVFHCFRCNVSGTLYKLLKQLIHIDKENAYRYKNLVKKYYSSEIKNKLESIDKVVQKNIKKYNLNKITDKKLIKYINYRLNINYNKSYELQKIFYQINKNNLNLLAIKRLNTLTLYNIYNNKKWKEKIDNFYLYDMFYSYENNNKNLFIAEGEFDILTVKLHYEIKGDYIAVGGKNFNNIWKVLLQMKNNLYYENLILVADNDTTNKFYINSINKNKYKFFENLYILRAPRKFKDINEYFIKNTYKLENLMLTKIKI